MKNKFLVFSIVFSLVIAGQFALMNYKLLRTRKSISARIDRYRADQKAMTHALNKSVSTAFSLPKELHGIPYLDGEVILKVDEVDVRNVFAPHNGSLIEKDENGFLLFFRYDLVRQMHFNQFETRLGCVELDENFKQTEKEYISVNTKSAHSEDPRVIKNQENLYLVYNDGPTARIHGRMMHIAHLDDQTYQPVSIATMNPRLSAVEKNWPPFVYDNTVHFEYLLFTPRRILRLEDPENADELHFCKSLPMVHLDWERKWGTPLGGSSARLVDGQYLAFFHSKFQDECGKYWYVLGAYTFEAKPPFRVTAISKEPILFRGIYRTESLNTSDPQKYVIFPGGYAIKSDGDRTVLHLACGENDSVVKILTIDKEALLAGLENLSGEKIKNGNGG